MGGFARLAQQARAAVAERERRVPLDALRELVRTAPPTVDAMLLWRRFLVYSDFDRRARFGSVCQYRLPSPPTALRSSLT